MKGTMHVGLLAILLSSTMGLAQAQQQPGAGAEPAPPAAKITQEEATKIALERIPGKVTEVTIERKRGRNVYVVEIQTQDDGEKDVFVDIETGRIVGTD
jgi:uncharacterized membrane protein YkoI